MTFDEVLAHVRKILQHQGRVSYRALKRRFQLDDDYLEDVKAELIEAQRIAIDEAGTVLVWAGNGEAAPAFSREQARLPPRYTPSYLAEKILTSRTALEGERKQVTVLFADMEDSMELLAGRDPEDARLLLDPVIVRLMEAVHRYEGTVNQVLGDGIMALFGAPIAHEDHALRACYAALAMQESIGRYSEEVAHQQGIAVRIRVGLNSGEVVVCAIGNDLHMEYSAVGQTTHLAARMEQLASGGSIVLTAQTLRLVEGMVQVNPRGPVAVKGLVSAVEVFELLGAKPTWTHLQAFAVRGLSRFVGRQAELATLSEALDQASAGQGRVIALIGEPGMGKTRLFYEFSHAPHTHGCLVLESSAVSFGKVTPYLPIIALLKAYFQVESSDDPRKIREKITGKLLALDVAFGPLLAVFFALLDVPVEDLQWLALDPLQRHRRTLEAITRLLLQESQVQPVILMIENLHWLDSESQAVLDHLLESVPTARLLLLVNYRPEYQHSWGSKAFLTQLQLDALPPASVDELLQDLLGSDSGLHPLKQCLMECTQGNPFFLEESVRDLVETHALDGAPGAYRLTHPLQRVQVPATVQAVLAARIDRLPADEKNLLQAAAVIGRDVPFALLQVIAGQGEEPLRAGLAHLQNAAFLYESRIFPELVYTFKHALTQEVAYGSLLERRRQVYHRAAACGLEALYTDRLDEVLELLAHHFGCSVEDEKAVDYAILAAEKAQRHWANAVALTHFEAARTRLKTMPDTEANRLRHIDAVLKQGEVKFALGQHMAHLEALEGLHHLVDTAADPRRRATWYYWMGFLYSLTGREPRVAIDYCREAVTIAMVNGFDDLWAFADSCLAQVYTVTGDLHAAVTAGERALLTFEARANIWWTCRTLWHLIVAANAMGAWQQSLAYCHRALEHGRALDDLRLRVVGWCRTGSTHIQRGDPQAGLRCCEEALALAPIPYDAAMIRAVRGHGLIKTGEAEAGTAELSAAVAWFEHSHLRYTGTVFRLRLGEGYLRQGDRRRARAIFAQALATSRETGYRHLEGIALRCLGESLSVEDPRSAAEHLASAVEVLTAVGARNEIAKTLAAQAHLCQAAGDHVQARYHFGRALALYEALGTLDEPLHVRAALAAFEDNPPS